MKQRQQRLGERREYRGAEEKHEWPITCVTCNWSEKKNEEGGNINRKKYLKK